MSRLRLGLISERPPSAPAGFARALTAAANPAAIAAAWAVLTDDATLDGWLTWLGDTAPPDVDSLVDIFESPGDLWHTGAMASESADEWLRWVNPTFMHSAPLAPELEAATCWRVTLAHSLVRRSAVSALDGPSGQFESLTGAGIELGFRYLRRGAVVRRDARLRRSAPSPGAVPSPRDQARFIALSAGRLWARWALGCLVVGGRVSPLGVPELLATIRQTRRGTPLATWESPSLAPETSMAQGSVTVLIPTIDRYPYLETVLEQLANQSRRPDEIIVIDQTPRAKRRRFPEKAAPVPVVWLEQEEPGQCSSRNRGLEVSSGDFILFLDDDDEVESDLIERHLKVLDNPAIDVSSGVAEEVDGGPLPDDFRHVRIADVFPTNNTMARRAALEASGLFDLAYDRGQRADRDLGIRIHQTGALMVLRPEISVLHHHAPMGGLRTHKARVVTYGQSRARITARALPTPSEYYLAARYFGRKRWKAISRLGVLGTFRLKGSRPAQVAKIIAGLVYLPNTLWRMSKAKREALDLLERHPTIGYLSDPIELSEASGS